MKSKESRAFDAVYRAIKAGKSQADAAKAGLRVLGGRAPANQRRADAARSADIATAEVAYARAEQMLLIAARASSGDEILYSAAVYRCVIERRDALLRTRA